MARLTRMIALMIDPDDYPKIKEAARRDHRSVSNYIRQLIHTDLREKRIVPNDLHEELRVS